MFALAVDPVSVEERETRVVRAHGPEIETLLVSWLNECLYVLDVEGFVARRVEFLALALDAAALGGEPLRLHCLLHGEEIDPARHLLREGSPGRVAAKGAVVKQVGGGFQVWVVAGQ